jgi:2'-5' RNA ligase
MYARYAVYFSPDDQSALAHFGQHVLGRSAEHDRSDQANSAFSDHERWYTLTERPAYYGFHATLKAPFELSSTHRSDDLIQACSALATRHKPIVLSGLAPRRMGSFAALTLPVQPPTLSDLANDCVLALEPWRATISEHDIKRRLGQGLSERQVDQLTKYGYPYIFDDFLFHMTLSSELSSDDSDFMQWLLAEYERYAIDDPLLDRIVLYAQTDRNSAFLRLREFSLSRSNSAQN